jgi:hypothetical protein
MRKQKKEMHARDESLEITGIVIPIAWREDSSPVACAISAYDEQEYQIDSKDIYKDGWHHVLGKKIRASGIIHQIDKNRKKIKISEFVVVPE